MFLLLALITMSYISQYATNHEYPSFKMLERHHLEALLAIKNTGTLTKAADAMHITQSALSHSFKKLEQRLGSPLWRKHGRRIELTAIGERILLSATDILTQFTRLEEDVKKMQSGFSGNLKIGIECYPCFSWLLKIIGPFMKQFPDIDVDVRNEFRFGGLAALQNHEIDLLITPDKLPATGIEYITAFSYELMLVTAKDSPLSLRPHVSPDDLENEVLLTYPVSVDRLDIFTQFLLPAEGHVKSHKTAENTELMLEMVVNNRGVASLPDWLVSESDYCSRVSMLKLGHKGIPRSTYFALNSGSERAQITQGFIEQLITMAPPVNRG